MFKKVFTIIVYIFAIIGFVLVAGYFAVKFGLTNTNGIVDNQRQNFLANVASTNKGATATTTYAWQSLSEWQTLKSAVLKDQPVILRASATAGIPARLIVSALIVEQLRFFFDDRTSYEKFFAPLKILGSQTQFSWGVMGIKEETAIQIENNLKDPTSPYYLGPQFEHLLDFKTSDIATERFTRMTDQHDHYYSYLYAGLYLAEIEHQWNSEGFNISNRPEILSTLYNVGFANSRPKADPQSGGAAISIGTQTESFGSLAGEFYNSSELLNEFPR